MRPPNKHQCVKIAQGIMDTAWAFRQAEGGEVLSTWFLLDRKGRMQIVGTPFDDAVPDSKARVSQVVAQVVADVGAELALFVSDAWVRTVDPDDNEAELTQPSQSWDAVEAIIVTCWSRAHPRTDFMLCRRYRQRDNGELEIISDEQSGHVDTFTFKPVVDALREPRSG